MRRLCFVLALFFFTSLALHARSGCCSHHGGVCGCSCCDGSPLSDICAPYYPNCGGGGGSGGGGGGGNPLPAPSHLGGYYTSSTQCVLNWSDNSIGESYFQIEEKDENQGFYTAVATADADVTTATIDNLSPATSYVFRIRARGGSGDSGYSNEATVTTPPDPGKICQAPAVCFNGSRFKVDAQWKTPTGASGTATIVRLTDSSGYLWFFDSSNVEVVFKILNGCAINTAYWFYAGGLTNVQVTITVTDTKTGAVKTYANPQGKAFQPVQDVTAFNTCP